MGCARSILKAMSACFCSSELPSNSLCIRRSPRQAQPCLKLHNTKNPCITVFQVALGTSLPDTFASRQAAVQAFFVGRGGGTTHYIVACIQTEALLASVLVVPEESDVRMTAVRAGSYGRCFGGQRHWTSWAVHKLQREMCDRWKLAWGLGSNVGVVRREHPWPNHDNVHGLMHSGRGVRGGGSTTSRV